MSIVLVIIGLVVGGVLVGRDLIRAAYERAQLSQLEKFNQAVNTFYGKYGYLPGDILAPRAAQFGFAPRGSNPGQGDGNGMLEGNAYNAGWGNTGTTQSDGETVMFWVDLSTAGLIPSNFNTATCCGTDNSANITGTALNLYFPQAAIGNGTFVLVMGGAGGNVGYMNFTPVGSNYYVLEGVSLLGNGFNGTVNPIHSLTVQQAYDLDKKIDDGYPTSGSVLAVMLATQATWVEYQGPPTNSAVFDPGTRCYSNGNVGGAPMAYSISHPSTVSCTLAFRFQ